MDSTDLKQNAFFTTDGSDVWKLGSYCLHPTCELTNMETNEKASFGMNGLTAQRFHRIAMPGVKKVDQVPLIEVSKVFGQSEAKVIDPLKTYIDDPPK